MEANTSPIHQELLWLHHWGESEMFGKDWFILVKYFPRRDENCSRELVSFPGEGSIYIRYCHRSVLFRRKYWSIKWKRQGIHRWTRRNSFPFRWNRNEVRNEIFASIVSVDISKQELKIDERITEVSFDSISAILFDSIIQGKWTRSVLLKNLTIHHRLWTFQGYLSNRSTHQEKKDFWNDQHISFHFFSQKFQSSRRRISIFDRFPFLCFSCSKRN